MPFNDLGSTGYWNAATNVPPLKSGMGTTGKAYQVKVAGSTLIDGINDWRVDDIIFYWNDKWLRIPGSETLNYFSDLYDLTALASDYPNAKRNFGAVGDGVTDDTPALQAALDSNRVTALPPGKYRTTTPLWVDPIRNRGNGFVGFSTFASRYPYTQQAGGPAWTGVQEAVIFYDGPTSSTAAVIAASAEAVGVEPASTFANTIWGFTLHNVLLDANNKAGFGLYAARVQDVDFDHLVTRGATVAGQSFNGTYSGSNRSPRAYLNPGRGIEVGAADIRWGWTVNDKNNAFYMYDVHTYTNGSDATFRDTDPVLMTNGCGLYFGPHRGCFIYGIVSELNYGANVVFIPTSGGNQIFGMYTELGSRWAANGAGTDAITLGYATVPYGLIFVGNASGGSQHCGLIGATFADDYIWLTGTQPTAAREEAGFLIADVSLGRGTIADWGNYKFRDCSAEIMTVTGVEPIGAHTLKGGVQFKAAGGILNWYEEGFLTPTLRGATIEGTGWAYSLNTGWYTRTGRVVEFGGICTVSAVSGDATGQIQLAPGLPFNIPNSNAARGPVLVTAEVLATAVVSTSGSLLINSRFINLSKRTAAATSSTSLASTDLAVGSVILFSGKYYTV